MQVTIRPLIEQDAYFSVKWRNDPAVFKYTGNTYDHEITIDSELEWIRKVIHNPKEYRCAIMVDGVYVGNIYLTNIDAESAHYHIFIGDRDYWGKNISTIASQLILNYAFSIKQLKFVSLKVHKDNTIAISLYKKLGFDIIKVDGKWISMIITKESFTESRANMY